MQHTDNPKNTGREKQRQSRDGLFFYPWEKTFKRLITPFENFIERQTTGGLLLMLCAAAAMILANSPLRALYNDAIHTHIAVAVGPWSLDRSLLHWINEGLMVFFFFVVGLEIKREIIVGELSTVKSALLPFLAALGGMIFPALFYFIITRGGPGAVGWGIPMATDIAFCVSVLVILGRRIPQPLMVLLVAMAIVDDIGAVLVIAVFYTSEIGYVPLAGAAALLAVLVAMNLSGIRRSIPYLLIGIGLWLCLLFSGIHATIAGILIAFCIPAHGRYDAPMFHGRLQVLLTHFQKTASGRPTILGNEEQISVLNAMTHEIQQVRPPVQHLLDVFHLPVALLIIPFFALVNSGVTLDLASLGEVIAHPVTLGVMAGLVAGKSIGITLVCWLAVRFGIASLPEGITLRHIFGIGLIGGIGFTMSIFISELSFGSAPELLELSKTGIIFGSLVAGILGTAWLFFASSAGKQA